MAVFSFIYDKEEKVGGDDILEALAVRNVWDELYGGEEGGASQSFYNFFSTASHNAEADISGREDSLAGK